MACSHPGSDDSDTQYQALIVWADRADQNHHSVAGKNSHWLAVGMHPHWKFDMVYQRTSDLWLQWGTGTVH
jgi:hypothetical protein